MERSGVSTSASSAVAATSSVSRLPRKRRDVTVMRAAAAAAAVEEVTTTAATASSTSAAAMAARTRERARKRFIIPFLILTMMRLLGNIEARAVCGAMRVDVTTPFGRADMQLFRCYADALPGMKRAVDIRRLFAKCRALHGRQLVPSPAYYLATRRLLPVYMPLGCFMAWDGHGVFRPAPELLLVSLCAGVLLHCMWWIPAQSRYLVERDAIRQDLRFHARR